MFRRIYHIYRNLQNIFFKRSKYSALTNGIQCNVLDISDTQNHGDIVHPCVRYIPDGFRGHKWWMVYTPYYKANPKMENPILCWGKSENSVPPTEWVVEDYVVEEPNRGYNSDPYLYYEDGRITIFWRENDTDRVLKDGYRHATYAKIYNDDGKSEIVDTPILYSKKLYYDNEVSPAFYRKKDGYIAYATHFRFKLPWMQFGNKKMKKISNKLFMILSLMGIYSQQKMYGLSIWACNDPVSKYHHVKTVKWHKCCRLYKPWHLDYFTYDNKMYLVVQSNSENADILLAESDDGENFKFYALPLITSYSIGMKAIYKPSAVVIGREFHLFYTAQTEEAPGHNKLFVTSCDFVVMINKLKK